MRIKINTTQYDLIKGISSYNRNYYENRLTGECILEEFDESNEQYTFYLFVYGIKYVIGESYAGFKDEMLITIFAHPSVSMNGNTIVIKINK